MAAVVRAKSRSLDVFASERGSRPLVSRSRPRRMARRLATCTGSFLFAEPSASRSLLARPAPAVSGDEGIPLQDPRWGQNSGSGSQLTPAPARCRAAVLTAPGKVPHARSEVRRAPGIGLVHQLNIPEELARWAARHQNLQPWIDSSIASLHTTTAKQLADEALSPRTPSTGSSKPDALDARRQGTAGARGDPAGARDRVERGADVAPDLRDPAGQLARRTSSTASIAVSSATSPALGNDSGERAREQSFITFRLRPGQARHDGRHSRNRRLRHADLAAAGAAIACPDRGALYKLPEPCETVTVNSLLVLAWTSNNRTADKVPTILCGANV
jgi:hypothetical protein